ncbi:MAG: TIGR01212 family radical SAM protein [Clostridia bacterium]|nr:TIGR01212 family radical SAM protein [Clostridia bacterium]
MTGVKLLSDELQKRFGTKVYKLSLESGATCPNRDGTVGVGGCIFCSLQGSGEFAASGYNAVEQIEKAKEKVAKKLKGEKAPLYIAYFQDYSGTYAPIKQLRKRFFEAIAHPEVAILSIATRPDCLGKEVLSLLAELNKIKPVWVELGLQTIHESTAQFINRGYALPVFDKAVCDLKAIGCEVVVHMILGLPGEDEDMAVQTARYIGKSGADGVKFHLLYVPSDTALAKLYQSGKYTPLSLEGYTNALLACLRSIPCSMTVHRLTGDGDKRTLLAPLWSADKKRTLQYIYDKAKQTHLAQGEDLKDKNY